MPVIERPLPRRETAPVGFNRPQTGNRLLQVAQHDGKGLPVMLGQWEIVVTFFKNELEVPRCLNPEDVDLAKQHRVVLVGAMSLGEIVSDRASAEPDFNAEALGYPKNFIESNLEWLRGTYRQWYVERDQKQVDSDFLAVSNACARTDK